MKAIIAMVLAATLAACGGGGSSEPAKVETPLERVDSEVAMFCHDGGHGMPGNIARVAQEGNLLTLAVRCGDQTKVVMTFDTTTGERVK